MNKKIIAIVSCGCVIAILVGCLAFTAINSQSTGNSKKIYTTELRSSEITTSPYLYKGPIAFDSGLSSALENWQQTREFFGVILNLDVSMPSFENDSISIAKGLGINGKLERHLEGYFVRDAQTEEQLVYIIGPKIGQTYGSENNRYCIYFRYETNYSTEPVSEDKFISNTKAAEIAWDYVNKFVSVAWKHAKSHVTLKLSSIHADIVSEGTLKYITTKVVSFRVSYDNYDTGADIMLRVNSAGRVVWMNAFAEFTMVNIGLLDAHTPNKVITYLTNNGVGISRPASLVSSATITNISIYYATSSNTTLTQGKEYYAVAVPLYDLQITIIYKDNAKEIVSKPLKVDLI
ncbi:MAG: hypothetical protein QXU48_02375 [Thermoplasmata archaeon]